jgi:hypothetical protein
MNSKNKNIRDLYRGINEFKGDYQSRSNLVKDENGDSLADSHNILNWLKSNLSQLCNVHRVSDVLQIEIHTAELLVPSSQFEVETAIVKLKKYKLPGNDQILVNLIQVGGETLWPDIHKLIYSSWYKEELSDQWGKSITVPIYKKGNRIDCGIYSGISLLPTSYKILYNLLLSRVSPYIDENIVDHQCGFQWNSSTSDEVSFFF